MDIVKVVCGIIWKEDKVFLCRRNAAKSLAGYWEFPGGKVEPGEKEAQALSRELLEELGMQVTVEAHFKTVLHHYDHIAIELVAYTCSFVSASYTLSDHDHFEWVAPPALLSRKLAPADIPVARALAQPGAPHP